MYSPNENSLAYLKSRRLWCWLSLLLLAELIVFAVLNTTPNDHYSQYVSESLGANESAFGFILLGNLKSSLVLLGTIPLGLGTVFGTYMTVSGLISTVKWLQSEVGGLRMLLCVLSHGIFEILALYCSVLLSVLWSRAVTLEIIRLCKRKPSLTSIKEDGMFFLKSIVYVPIPLILIAAVMEVPFSSLVMNFII